MFSSIINYFATGQTNENESAADQPNIDDNQSQQSPQSELEKLKKQNEQIREQLEQKFVLKEHTNADLNLNLTDYASVITNTKNSQKDAITQLLTPQLVVGKGSQRDGHGKGGNGMGSGKKGDKKKGLNDKQVQICSQKQQMPNDQSINKLQFQQSQSMKKTKSIQKDKKMDNSKAIKKNHDDSNNQINPASAANHSQEVSLELDKIHLGANQQQNLCSQSSRKQSSPKKEDQASLKNQDSSMKLNNRKHQQSDQICDPITGVLKHKINKNSKKTKEVSLTLNHSNIQQLVQLLQSQSNDGSKEMPDLLDSTDDPSHQQALNLIMQLITNNVHSSLSDSNSVSSKDTSASMPQGIDPQLLQQLFYIDKEEEECSDSDEDDDNESDEDDIDDDDSDDNESDDDEDDSDEDEDDDLECDLEAVNGDDEHNAQKMGMEDYDDEEEPQIDKIVSSQSQAQNADGVKKLGPSQRLQNQLNRQKLAKKKEANMLYNQSSSDSNENLSHVDLLHENEKHGKQAQNPQRVKDKLQKRKKQLEAQKAQLQHLQQQQKLQARMQKKRMKQQQDAQDQHINVGQQKQGVGHSQKQYSEDKNLNKNDNDDDLQCQEEYIEQDQKCKGQQDTATVEGDNSSQYEDLEYDSEQTTSQNQQFQNNQNYNQTSQQNLQKLLKQKLVISDKLSPQFHRFYENFLQNINYIIQYEYNILPEQKFYQNFGDSASSGQNNSYYLTDQKARDAAEAILKKKYDNLRKLCEQNCKCFTGPHSVLQIFIEKIVQAVESFSGKLRLLARDDLQLWIEDSQFNSDEYQSDENEPNLNELNYSINGIDLNTIFKMQKLSQSEQGLADGIKQGLKDGMANKQGGKNTGPTSSVEAKLKQIEMNTKSEEAKEKLRALGKMTDNEIQQLVFKAGEYLKNKRNSKKFKPLLKNLPNYTNFLQSVIFHYNLIINTYAPAISRHFTDMTQVIKEGNQYEFPSQDIHRTIINKLIINDHNVFRHFFQHIRQEYVKHEKSIKKKIAAAQQAKLQNQQQTLLKDSSKDGSINGISKSTQNLIKFVEVFEQFVKDVETDISKGVQQLNIDYYMRDLRKHALEEYDEIHQIEEALQGKVDGKPINQSTQESLEEQSLDYNEKLNQRYGFMLDAKEKKKLKKKQRKRDKKAKQQAQNTVQSDQDEVSPETMQKDYDEDIQLSPEVFKKQYDINDVINFDLDDIKNLSNKKKKGKGGGKLSQEEIKNLSTDELLSYIESEGKAKKQGALNEQAKVGLIEEQNFISNNIDSDVKGDATSADKRQLGESKQMQQMRAKAKAFIEKQQQQKQTTNPKKPEEKVVDPNNFTCKFCNGSVNSKTGKFVHEKFCLVATQGEKAQKGKNNQQSVQNAETSTQASRSTQSSKQKDTTIEQYDEEDQHIEEFARKLEMIQKQPSGRHTGSGGQRRRKKLKPNVSNDWVNKLRKTLKSQNQSNTPFNLGDIQNTEIGESSDSMGSYTSSSNSTMAGNQCSSEAQLQKKRTKLSDLTQDQISIEDVKRNENVKFNPQKLNLSVSASQNRKKMQAQAKKE